MCKSTSRQKVMLQPRLTDCVNCITVSNLLKEIDCKINELSFNLYNNLSYLLNKKVNTDAISDLINYKRILTYKLCNEHYAPNYTIEMIASKIKILKFK